MDVLHIFSAMVPLRKTAGLADVIGGLPAPQIAEGVVARVLLPAFPVIRRGVTDAQVVSRRHTFAGHITLLFGHYNGVRIYLIDAPHLYDRPGSPYHDTNLFAYTDNVLRFALLGGVGAEMARGLDPFWRPDVV
ncbi:glycogen/starch synthase, partial [Escherichia coli]|uniref:glycogen/starch synthase n=1 Tax=Escherichia coli TaxID=562 RepID=UPI002FEF9F19